MVSPCVFQRPVVGLRPGYLNLSIGLRPKCSCYGSRSPRGPCLDSCSRISSRLSVQSYVWETLSEMVCKNRDRWWSHNLVLQKPLNSGRVFFQRSWFCVRKNLLGLDKLFVRRTAFIGIGPRFTYALQSAPPLKGAIYLDSSLSTFIWPKRYQGRTVWEVFLKKWFYRIPWSNHLGWWN